MKNSYVFTYDSLLFFQLDPSKMDRIELAFRKFDLNHDGFLSRDEFDQVSLKIVINCNVL